MPPSSCCNLVRNGTSRVPCWHASINAMAFYRPVRSAQVNFVSTTKLPTLELASGLFADHVHLLHHTLVRSPSTIFHRSASGLFVDHVHLLTILLCAHHRLSLSTLVCSFDRDCESCVQAKQSTDTSLSSSHVCFPAVLCISVCGFLAYLLTCAPMWLFIVF